MQECEKKFMPGVKNFRKMQKFSFFSLKLFFLAEKIDKVIIAESFLARSFGKSIILF